MRRAGHVARMGERRGVYRVLVGKPEGKRPLERPKRRWENNIKDGSSESGMWGYGLDRSGLKYMGGACSTYGGEERRIQGFGGET